MSARKEPPLWAVLSLILLIFGVSMAPVIYFAWRRDAREDAENTAILARTEEADRKAAEAFQREIEKNQERIKELACEPVTDRKVLAMLARLKRWGGINEDIRLQVCGYVDGQAVIYRQSGRMNDPVIIDIDRGYLEFLKPNQLQAVLGHELGHLYCGHIDDGRSWGFMSQTNIDREQAEADAFSIKMVGLATYTSYQRASRTFAAKRRPDYKPQLKERVQRAVSVGEPPRRLEQELAHQRRLAAIRTANEQRRHLGHVPKPR